MTRPYMAPCTDCGERLTTGARCRSCYYTRAASRTPDLAALLARGVRDGDCLMWPGTKPGSYPSLSFSRRKELLHRIVFRLANGWAPSVVCHSCDRPGCFEPTHLVGGTQRDNMVDMARKGRRLQRLTSEQVAEARRLAEAGLSQRAIAARYGVAHGVVGRHIRRTAVVLGGSEA